jgi:hypothetical protein
MAIMEGIDLEIQSWWVDASEIEFCRRPDGSDWLLGEGSYGKVLNPNPRTQGCACPELIVHTSVDLLCLGTPCVAAAARRLPPAAERWPKCDQ